MFFDAIDAVLFILVVGIVVEFSSVSFLSTPLILLLNGATAFPPFIMAEASRCCCCCWFWFCSREVLRGIGFV